MLLRDKLLEEYNRYKLRKDIFIANTTIYQEETFLCLVAHKNMLRWVEKAHMVLTQIEYFKEIQKG
jgi:hypothetical protein